MMVKPTPGPCLGLSGRATLKDRNTRVFLACRSGAAKWSATCSGRLEPGESLLWEHALEYVLYGHGVAAKAVAGEEVAGAAPAIVLKAYMVDVVIAVEGHL